MGRTSFFWACKNEHPQQTIVLTNTAGQQPGSGHCCLRSSECNASVLPNWESCAWANYSSLKCRVSLARNSSQFGSTDAWHVWTGIRSSSSGNWQAPLELSVILKLLVFIPLHLCSKMLYPFNIQWLPYLILRTHEFPLHLFYRLSQSRVFPYPQVKKKKKNTKGEKQVETPKRPFPCISPHVPLLGPEIDPTGKPMTHA